MTISEVEMLIGSLRRPEPSRVFAHNPDRFLEAACRAAGFQLYDDSNTRGPLLAGVPIHPKPWLQRGTAVMMDAGGNIIQVFTYDDQESES